MDERGGAAPVQPPPGSSMRGPQAPEFQEPHGPDQVWGPPHGHGLGHSLNHPLEDQESQYLRDPRLMATKIALERHYLMPPINNYDLFPGQGIISHRHMQHHQPLQIHQQHQHPMPPMQQMHQQHLLGYQPRHEPPYGLPNHHILPTYDESSRNFVNPIDSMNSPMRSYDHQPVNDNSFVDNYLTNWPGDPSGIYSPFGHNFLTVQTNSSYSQTSERETQPEAELKSKIEVQTPPTQDITVKKRIVAEVKPMRPSYSAVLSKTPKTSTNPELSKKVNSKELKSNTTRLNNSKIEKPRHNSSCDKPALSEDKVKKTESKRKLVQSQPSSGSDSGENMEQKPSKPNRRPNENINRKWVSLDDLSNEKSSSNSEHHQNSYTENNSNYIFNSAEEKSSKKKFKKPTVKTNDKTEEKSFEVDNDDFDNPDVFEYQEPIIESDKNKRKSKDRLSNGAKMSAKSNSDKGKRNSQFKSKKGKGSGYMALIQTYLDGWIALMLSLMFWFYNLVSDICQMSVHLSVDLFSSMCTETSIWMLNGYALFREKVMNTQWICNIGTYIDNKVGHTFIGFWRKLKWFKLKSENESDNSRKNYTNIPLPSTGDEAMKRLLACKGKDPYSILGVGVQCTDDDIKKYYRRQAFLVHPDKNQQPGAEEAFKILQHAFDMIGEPERREAYEQRVLECRHAEAARSELADLVAKLQEKVRRAASTIRCSGCSRRHARTPTNRPCYAARYCAQCKINHSAKEGDIWAESSFFGLVWMYYACMDGAVYQITQWASCQKKNLKHLKANTHHVQYRIVHGNKPQQGSGSKTPNNNIHEADLEDFLNNLYTKSGVQSPTANSSNKNMPPTNESMKNKRKNKKQH